MLAFTFPGQGSQKHAMGRPWADHPAWSLVADLSDASHRDVAALLLEADDDALQQTRSSQLATFAMSMIVLRAVRDLGIDAQRVAGHSLGEYSALTAAGALDLAAATALVAERGEAMQVAAGDRPGAMSAVLGLDDDQVDIACARVGGDVWVANFNGPGQVVIAGDPAAVEAASAQAKELGARRVMALPVGGAFHTPFMASARDRLRAALGSVAWRATEVPVIANVDALPHTDGEDWDGLLAAQLTSPVRWRQSIHQLVEDGVTTFVEIGPGTVLTGLTKRIANDARALSVSSPADLEPLAEALGGESVAAVRHEGEHLFGAERIVVSPAAGIFTPSDVAAGHTIEPGRVMGRVGEHEVRSPFKGAIMGLLAVAGERVTPSQPIAWLRIA
jgi:[acyl-carrier-protein] S-malonyltransferase